MNVESKDFRAALRDTIQCEIGKLLEQTQEADRVRKREREQSDARRDASISRLLEIQIEETEAKTQRERIMYRLLAATLAVVTSGSGGALYVVSNKESPVREEIKSIREESRSIEERVKTTEDKIERVAESVVGQQVQISDGFDYLGAKIDAAHPRTAGAVAEPESVTEAKRAATEIKRKRGVKQLFSGIE